MAARTPLTPLSVSRAGLTALPAPSQAADVTNGNLFYNDGATALVLLNNDSATHTLTVQLASGVDGQSVTRSYTIPVSANRQATGFFPLQYYGNQVAFNVDSALVSVQAVSYLSP